MSVVKALWDSWADDAVIDDRNGGRYARADRIRPINHAGEYYQVAGPLNLPRCPQGRPVLVQAGSSDTGRRFAARHAEAVFTAHMEKATAQAFYADLKALVAAEGDLAAAPFKLNSVSVRDDALAGGSLRQSCVRSPICGPDCTGQARS